MAHVKVEIPKLLSLAVMASVFSIFCTVDAAVPVVEEVLLAKVLSRECGVGEPPYLMVVSVEGTDLNSAVLHGPGEIELVLDPRGDWHFFDTPYACEAALDADWPGGDYTFVFNDGADSVTVTYTPQPIPAQFPVVTYPSHGQTGVELHPTFTWKSVDGAGETLWFVLRDCDQDYITVYAAHHSNMTAISWQPGPLDIFTEYELEAGVVNMGPASGLVTTALGQAVEYLSAAVNTNFSRFTTGDGPAPAPVVEEVLLAKVIPQEGGEPHPEEPPYVMVAGVEGTYITSTVLHGPGGIEQVLESEGNENEYAFYAGYESEAVLYAEWPAGEYTFVFNDGSESVTVTYTPQSIPEQFPKITYPAHEQTGVEVNPTYTWQSVDGTGDALWLSVFNDEKLYHEFPADIVMTEWQPGLLNSNTKHFFATAVANIDPASGELTTTGGQPVEYIGGTCNLNIVGFFTTCDDFASGSGTEANPYVITHPVHLDNVRNHLGSHFVLGSDINLGVAPFNTGQGWQPIGDYNSPFTGTFNGQGHTIDGLFIDRPEQRYVGLFGLVGDDGEISNLKVENVNTDGGEEFVGGLAGKNSGTIRDCAVTGTVSGIVDTGILVGANWYGGTISHCSVFGTVAGEVAGGLVGANALGSVITQSCANSTVSGEVAAGLVGVNFDAVISNCYATGDISGADVSGGLVGINGLIINSDELPGIIIDSYAVATVSGSDFVGGLVASQGFEIDGTTEEIIGLANIGQIENSFWNTDIIDVGVGYGNDTGAVGKTTVQMQTQSTFTNAGWDFLGESDNGTVDLWRICLDGVDYPRLRWEFSQMGDLVCPDGVGLADLAYLCQRWLWDDCGALNHCDWADINRDGIVDLMDFAVLSEHWLEGK